MNILEAISPTLRALAAECPHAAWEFLRREPGGWVEICTACGHEKFVPCTRALSIRQPWAWLIVSGYKDIENRSRKIGGHLGPVLIHASQTMSLNDYSACLQFISKLSSDLRAKIMVAKPTFEDLKSQCGGIVGKAFIRGQGNFDHNSQWWTGDYWYLLEQAKPFKFEPCKGQLGFFTPVIFQPLPTAQSL